MQAFHCLYLLEEVFRFDGSEGEMQRLELVLVFGFIESELCSNETQEHLCSNHFCMMKLILAVQDLLLNGQTLKLTSVPA